MDTPERVDCLHLDIQNCKCSCGNQWKQSEVWLASKTYGYLGGTPTPEQEWKLPVLSMAEGDRQVSHCFRCVPLGLGKSWIAGKNWHLEQIAKTKVASVDELLA